MPTSAARLIQARPSSGLASTPRPSTSMRPYQYCAFTTPSAARRNHCGRLAVVAFDADALGQADAEIERRDQIAGRGRLLEPLAGAHGVVRAAAALQQQVGEVDPRARVARLRRDAEPARRFLGVARHAGAGQVQQAQARAPPRWPASAARRNQIAASA